MANPQTYTYKWNSPWYYGGKQERNDMATISYSDVAIDSMASAYIDAQRARSVHEADALMRETALRQQQQMPQTFGSSVGLGSGLGNLTWDSGTADHVVWTETSTANGWVLDESDTPVLDKIRGKKKKNLKEYSNERFKKLTKAPLVKEILPSAVKIEKEEYKNRIAEYLKD